LDSYFTDVDSPTLTYTATGTSSISVNIDGGNRADFSQSSTFYGVEYIVFTANDGTNSTSSGSISLTVTQTSSSSAGSGGGGGGGAATATCSNECSAGNSTCISNTTLKQCGDYDVDSCLEFKTTICDYACNVGRCVSCIEDWDCTNWGDCSFGGTQIRTCTEKTICGTDYAKPLEIQSCTAPEIPGTTIINPTEGSGKLANDLNPSLLSATNSKSSNKTELNSTIICGDDKCGFIEVCWSDCKGSYVKITVLTVLTSLLVGLLYFKKQKQIGFPHNLSRNKSGEAYKLKVEDMFKKKTNFNNSKKKI
jgi:hypothetical protein